MSLLSNTPIWNGLASDLGAAFAKHLQFGRVQPDFALNDVSSQWLDAMRNRSRLPGQQSVLAQTDRMLLLLADPAKYGAGFRAEFEALYEYCGAQAYPLAWAIRDARTAIAAEARDYTLECFDIGAIRKLEDESLFDASLKSLLQASRDRLGAAAPFPALDAVPEVFENYSEALIYQKLKERGAGRFSIQRIEDSSRSNPDFECWIRPSVARKLRMSCISLSR